MKNAGVREGTRSARGLLPRRTMQNARATCFILVTSALFALAGCSGDDGKPSTGPTGPGSHSGTGGGQGSTTQTPTGDTSATEPAGAKKKNAEGPCASGAECESGVCFVGGNQSYCSVKCTVDTATTACAAPFTGSCNKQGYCKRD